MASPPRLSHPRQPEMDHAHARALMIHTQLRGRGIRDEAVLGALAHLPRHRFIPDENQDLAYRDGPVGIGEGQTISQPYVVALMTEALALEPGMKVLEVGTGCGYQAAVLATLEADVHSIEIRDRLSDRAAETLASLSIGGVTLHQGDGHDGLPAEAPFDRIIVTAAPEVLPSELQEQLRPGGRMLIPVGPRDRQKLLLIQRIGGQFTTTELLDVLFVPLTRRST